MDSKQNYNRLNESVESSLYETESEARYRNEPSYENES